MAADHNAFANLIWQIADLLRGPYRPPQYERVMLPMTVLRRFDSCTIPPNEVRELINRSNTVCTLLVALPYPPGHKHAE